MGDFGFKEIGMTALVFIPFMFLLKWVLMEVSSILKRETEERNKWQEIINGFNVCQAQMMAEHRDFREAVSEAHKFQRDEHKEMIGNLKEITQTLGRINGYKEEH